MANLTLAPPPYQTVLDTAGAPVPLAGIWTYTAGTTTPAATYSDALGTVNTNPIRADAAGRFTAYLVPGAGYKFVYETPATPPAHGAVIRTADNVVGTPPTPSALTGTWLPGVGGTATYSAREGTYGRVGALVFARGSLVIDTIGTGLSNAIQGLPFPAIGLGSLTVGTFTALLTPVVWLGGYVQDGTTQAVLIGLPAAGVSTAFLDLIGSGSALTFSLTYLTAAP